MLCERVACNGYHIQVIEAGKDGFFADSEASGYNGEFQIVIRLQGRLKQGTDQRCHPVIKATEIGILQRNVILIDQDDCSPSGTGIQTLRKEFQRIRVITFCPFQISDPEITFQFCIRQFSAFLYFRPMPCKLSFNCFFQHLKGKLIGVLLHGFQRNADHRIFSHVSQILFSGFHDL